MSNLCNQSTHPYSLRRVSDGSMRRMRRAGATLARAATRSRMAEVAANVAGSVARTPHSMARRNRTATSDMPRPAPMPTRESSMPGRTTPAIVCRAVAPSARRTPISTPLEVSGRVVRLQNEADPTDLLDETHEREIVVHWKSEEYGDMHVKLF